MEKAEKGGKMLTKVGKGTASKVEVELVARWAVAGLGDGLVALEVVLGPVVDGVGELELAVQGTVGAGDGAAAIEAPGLVKHHLLRLALADVLLRGARQPRLLLGRVAFALEAVAEAVCVDLEDVGRPRDDRDALVALCL